MTSTSPTGFDGRWLPADADPRSAVWSAPERLAAGGELANYRDYLQQYRLTLELKCQELSPEQLATRSVPPSELSLLGLVRHLGRVEHYWFHMVIEGNLDIERLDADDPTGGFRKVEPTPESVSEAFERWQQWRDHADRVLDGLSDGDLGEIRRDRHGDDLILREILVHLIEEYARHAGHADLLRECIDGRTGV